MTLGPTVTGCFEPVNGTCPTGCSECVCAAPTTPIATPVGDRPIADLEVGDLVYSVDHGSLAIVPIKLVHRQPVTGSHRVVELKLAHGATLRISPRHPTADGRHFSDLVAGDFVDGVRVIAARLVDYDQPFTYDILPDSDSGTYFAGGTLIGSTLSDRFGDFSTSATSGGDIRSARQPAAATRTVMRSPFEILSVMNRRTKPALIALAVVIGGGACGSTKTGADGAAGAGGSSGGAGGSSGGAAGSSAGTSGQAGGGGGEQDAGSCRTYGQSCAGSQRCWFH